MPVSLQDAAYAAGFFDGEGCISIVWQPNKITRRAGRTYTAERYWLMICLSQNDPAPIKWLIDRFGGSCRFVRGKRSYDRGHYERWDWKISTKEALQFLQIVRPFLIVKAEQADIAFEFAATLGKMGFKVSPQVQQHRANLYTKIKEARNAVSQRQAS